MERKPRSDSKSPMANDSSSFEDEDTDEDTSKRRGRIKPCAVPLAPGEQQLCFQKEDSVVHNSRSDLKKEEDGEPAITTSNAIIGGDDAAEHIKAISSEPDLPHHTLLSNNYEEDVKMHRSVSWGTITIIEHARKIGDNPACASGGPPITLSWKPIHPIKTIDLDIYENKRPSRRRQEEMMVPPLQREEWLRSEGYGTRQIYESIRQVRRAREERDETVEKLRYYRIEEFIESFRRKFARLRAKLKRGKRGEVKNMRQRRYRNQQPSP